MLYLKLNTALAGDTDCGSAAAAAVQGEFDSAPTNSPSGNSVGGGAAPNLAKFLDAAEQQPSTDDSASGGGSTAAANSSSAASNTTQTVTFANSAIVFNNTYTANVSAAYQNCILEAEKQIASTWSRSVTINVEFDAQSIANGFYAQNSGHRDTVSYAALKNALVSLSSAEPQNTYLQQAVANLPATDPSGGAGFALPVPYAQMLGFSVSNPNPELTVTLNTNYNWSYGQDVVDAMEHELSEGGMGRVGGLGDQNGLWKMMDLFRYNAAGQRDYTDGRDGQTTYFSNNGGATLSTLSFNNEYSGATQVNSGDTADFTEQDVFGVNGPGAANFFSQTDIQIMEALGWTPPPPPPTAVMIMSQPSTGNYEIYDIGNNSVLAAYPLTQAGSPWQPVDVGGFDGSDTSDLLLRSGSTGAFELYDVTGNTASGPVQLGAVGTDWSALGFGDFSSNPGETDMLMRQSGTAKLEVYDISDNQITGAASMGAVGPEWQFLGVGDFSSNPNETDMLTRDANNGALEVYNISHNAIVSATGMGAVGPEWQFVGVGDFSGNPGETDMLTHNSNTGAFEVYNIKNDQIVSANAMGAVGPEWSLVGIGDFSGNPGEIDMITRNGNTGAFEIYDISHDSIVSASSIGAVGTDWQTVGIAPYLSAGATAAFTDSSVLTGSNALDLQAESSSLPAPGLSNSASWLGSASGTVGAGWLQNAADNGSGLAASSMLASMATTFAENNSSPPVAGSFIHQT